MGLGLEAGVVVTEDEMFSDARMSEVDGVAGAELLTLVTGPPPGLLRVMPGGGV